MTPTDHQAQLEWEARVARPAAAAAIASVVVLIASLAIQLDAYSGVGDSDRAQLIAIDEHAGQIWAAIGLRDLSLLLLAFALWYLLRATRHRTALPGILAPLLPLGAVLLVAASIINQADVTSIASDFAGGARTEARADDLLDDLNPVGSAIGAGGTLAMALAIVLISLNAMRAGLLSRFMGVIGIITGALLVLPLSPLPIVQIFWLGALAPLFLGRWPGGRGPAWEAGEAIPWPSAAETRARVLGQPSPQPEPEPPHEPEPQPDPQHPVSKKRKRKRRG